MSIPRIPSDIYLDSSLIAAIIGGDPHSPASVKFCSDLAMHNSAVYFSQLLRLEVEHVIRNVATSGSAPQHLHEPYQLDQFNHNFMVRQKWMTFGMGELDALLQTFYVVYELPYRKRIWQRSVQLMSLYNLGSFDAAHVATALSIDVREFAAVDGHFRRVSDLRFQCIR